MLSHPPPPFPTKGNHASPVVPVVVKAVVPSWVSSALAWEIVGRLQPAPNVGHTATASPWVNWVLRQVLVMSSFAHHVFPTITPVVVVDVAMVVVVVVVDVAVVVVVVVVDVAVVVVVVVVDVAVAVVVVVPSVGFLYPMACQTPPPAELVIFCIHTSAAPGNRFRSVIEPA